MKAVALLIGANNYGFADIVQACVTNWLTSPSWWKNYCSDDSGISSRFTAARVQTEIANVRGAIENVAQAMTNAGYAVVPYTILAQTYTLADPVAGGFRYARRAGRARASAAAASGTATQLGAGHRRDDRQRHGQAGGDPAACRT